LRDVHDELIEALAQHLEDDVVERYFHPRESRISCRRALTLPMSGEKAVAFDVSTPLVLVDSRCLGISSTFRARDWVLGCA
jgi:hypothetical protein